MDSKSPGTEEADLVDRARHGDRQASAFLVERHWDRLYRWMFHLCHDAHQAEDLTQETFLKALGALAGYTAGSFQAWLFRIAYNTFLNQMRPKKRGVQQVSTDELPSRERDPAEVLLGKEGMQELMRGVGRLPSEYRAAFLLRVEEEMSFREVASILDITEETARWRVFKARQKLMEIMQPYLGEL